jgi:hypothetical protein
VRTIIAIDPGSRFTGIAIIQGPRAWSMVMKSQTVAEIEQFVIRCFMLFGSERVEFVLEDQYLAEHKDSNAPKGRGKINWPSVVKLVIARVRWQTVCELRDVKVSLANTGAWQGKMHATVTKFGPGGKKLTRKQRSKKAVVQVWRDVPRIEQPADVGTPVAKARAADKVTNDEADALCIGRFHQLYGGSLVVQPAPKPAPKPSPSKAPRSPRKRKAALEVVPA